MRSPSAAPGARQRPARRRARVPSPGRATLRTSSRRRTHQQWHASPLPWPTDPRIARPDGGHLRGCAGSTSAQHAQWEGLQVRHVHRPAGPRRRKPAGLSPHASQAQLRSACHVRRSAQTCAPRTVCRMKHEAAAEASHSPAGHWTVHAPGTSSREARTDVAQLAQRRNNEGRQARARQRDRPVLRGPIQQTADDVLPTCWVSLPRSVCCRTASHLCESPTIPSLQVQLLRPSRSHDGHILAGVPRHGCALARLALLQTLLPRHCARAHGAQRMSLARLDSVRAASARCWPKGSSTLRRRGRERAGPARRPARARARAAAAAGAAAAPPRAAAAPLAACARSLA